MEVQDVLLYESQSLCLCLSLCPSLLSLSVPLCSLCLSPCRFSVNVFQPPFQSGRSSPEGSQSRSDLPPNPAGPAPGSLEAGEGAGAEGASLTQERSSKTGQASATPAGEPDSSSLSTTSTSDSGFSEPPPSSSSQDSQPEKETSCEKAVRPEGTHTHTPLSGTHSHHPSDSLIN